MCQNVMFNSVLSTLISVHVCPTVIMQFLEFNAVFIVCAALQLCIATTNAVLLQSSMQLPMQSLFQSSSQC